MTSHSRATIVAACFGAAVATSWTAACTTMVVDFAAHDGGRPPPPSDAPVAPPTDGLGDGATPDSSTIGPREVTGLGNQFDGSPVAGPSRYAQYKCCDVTGTTCTVWIQGDGVSCRDAATWNMDADADCQSRGLIAEGLGLFVGC